MTSPALQKLSLWNKIYIMIFLKRSFYCTFHEKILYHFFNKYEIIYQVTFWSQSTYSTDKSIHTTRGRYLLRNTFSPTVYNFTSTLLPFHWELAWSIVWHSVWMREQQWSSFNVYYRLQSNVVKSKYEATQKGAFYYTHPLNKLSKMICILSCIQYSFSNTAKCIVGTRFS